MALALIVVSEFVVSLGWILQGWSVTCTVALASLTVIALVYGLAKQRSVDDVLPSRRSGRTLIGLAVTVAYCVLATVTIFFVLVMYGVNGRPATVPPSSGVLPLPTGLVVTGNTDGGCGSGSATVCSREIDVVSSNGASVADVVQRVRAYLESDHGWRLESDHGEWRACRTVNWLLDRHQECVGVFEHDSRAVIWLEDSDRW